MYLSNNQRGVAPFVILILVLLGAFIFWELSLMLERQFNPPEPATTRPANVRCDFPDPNDPCDSDVGAGFGL